MTRGELSVRMLLLLMLALLVAAPGADGFLSASVNTITPAGYSSSSNHNYRASSFRRHLISNGDSSSSTARIVKEFSQYEDLQQLVELASQPLPERPDGIVTVVKYSSSQRQECRVTEADYERLARANPATLFLRCMEEYDNAELVMGKADVQVWPTFDLFYGGNRVARIAGNNLSELDMTIQQYQFLNSDLDLFSEDGRSSVYQQSTPWGDGKRKNPNTTPRTTARFIPGYDWGSSKGFFDEVGDKVAQDFESAFENDWLPQLDDDDNGGKK